MEVDNIQDVDSETNQDSLPFQQPESAQHSFDATTFAAALLGLDGVKGLGRKGITALVAEYQDELWKMWETKPETISRILSKANVPAAGKVAERITSQPAVHVAFGISKSEKLALRRVSVIGPSDIPTRLRNIPSPPLWLFVQGNVEALYHRPAVAVVGTRKASDHGRRAAGIVAEMVAGYPIVLVSGLAPGIDEEAHAASLRQGAKNVAFLGHGINVEFPASSEIVRRQIVQKGGATVTEYLPDERYNRSYFVERNRLQAALADMVIPVEADVKSGTAHTFRFARKFERDIVGIRWDGCAGLVNEIERSGYHVVNIAKSSDRKHLDTLLRHLAEREHKETFALSLVEQRLRTEVASRYLRGEDVRRLYDLIDAILAGNTTEDDRQ